MKKHFNPLRVVRLSSPEVMAELIAAAGADHEAYLRDPKGWIAALTGKARREMLVQLRSVHDLAEGGAHGISVAVREAKAMGIKLRFGKGETIHDKAIHLLLQHPDLAHKDLHLLHVDELKNGRYWYTRKGMPKGKVDCSDEAREELGRAVGEFYRVREERGEHQHPDHIVSSDGTHYFFLYLSDYPERLENFDDGGNLAVRQTRNGFEVVFAYSPETRTLSTSAHGGAQYIGPLQETFAKIILHGRLKPLSPREKRYLLDGLLNRDFPFPIRPEDGLASVQVHDLTVQHAGGVEASKHQMDFSAEGAESSDGMYDDLYKYMGANKIPMSCLQVARTQLLLQFSKSSKCCPGGCMSIDLSPKASNIKNKPVEQRILAERLMRRWHLENPS